MNIAVFIKSTTFHAGYGGFEIQNKLLCEGLARMGHHIVVYAPQKEIEVAAKVENGVNYTFVPCKFGNFKTLYSGSKNSWEVRSLEYFINDHKKKSYDVVLGQSSWALPIIRRKKDLGIRVISILHGTKMGEYQTQLKNVKTLRELGICLRDLPHVMRTFFGSQREFVQGSDRLIAVSNFVKNAIFDETYVDLKKVEVINNGVDPSIYEGPDNSDKNPEEPVQIIYVGRIIRAKGLFTLINSLRKVKNTNWHLKIVGDGESLEELKSYIDKKELQDKVECLGKKAYRDTLSILAKSDIFVLPSLRMEGFPMTIVEAMFSGLPSIVSDIGGNSDAVVNGETGYLVKPGDENALAEKLDDLISDKERRLAFGINARTRALKEFTIEKMLNRYIQVIEEVIK